jgi:SAM-dependent methyltransferase
MTDSLLSEFYERFHQQRQKTGTVRAHGRLDFIRNEVGTGNDVLELGCRFGDVLAMVADRNRCTGADIDRSALDACARKLGIPTVVANLNERLPFADTSFDVVILSEVLEHLPYPAITLSEIRRVLRPGGRVVGSVPNGARLPNKIRFLLTDRVETDPTHLFHYSARTLGATLSSHFINVRISHASSRLMWLSPRHFANYLYFSAQVSPVLASS